MSSFRTPYSTPTEEQAALVGHIVMDCAILEFCLLELTSRLAFMPDLPGRAVLGQMPASQLRRAAARLLELHEHRYQDRVVAYENRLAIAAALRQAETVQASRNRFAHHISLRSDDDRIDMFQLSMAVLENAKHHQHQTLEDMRGLRREVRAANEALEAVIGLLPEPPEARPLA